MLRKDRIACSKNKRIKTMVLVIFSIKHFTFTPIIPVFNRENRDRSY